jgi:hypothetical protein
MFHEVVFDEILEVHVVSSRGRRNHRGVKRKMSNYPIRSRCSPSPNRMDIEKQIVILM